MQTRTAVESNFPSGTSTVNGNPSFAFQHGMLTYHELTIKDRHQNPDATFDDEGFVVGDPVKLEELTVGDYRREYGIVRKVPEGYVTAFPQKYQWYIQQTNGNPSPEEKEMHPEHPGAYYIVCDASLNDVSPSGLYNPRNFGLNLELRFGGNAILDTTDVEFGQGIFSQLMEYAEARNLPMPNASHIRGGLYIVIGKQNPDQALAPYINGFFAGPEKLYRLWNTPLLLSIDDYVDLMAIHAWALTGNDIMNENHLGDPFYLKFIKDKDKMRNPNPLSAEETQEYLRDALEHLSGFSFAAKQLGDNATNQRAEALIKDIVACI